MILETYLRQPPLVLGCVCIKCNELEAVEACKWLRAAGFPQYAQMYEDFQFPLDLLSVERDHSFLDRDSIHALFRRLKILNRCARIRIDSAKKTKIADSDEDQECALSGNWEFQADSRRWSRVDTNQMTISGRHEDQKSNDYERKRGTSETSEDLIFGQFKRSGSERLRDGAKAILRRMESLKSKKKRKHRDGIIISSPTILDDINMQARMEELGCVDISPDASPQIHSREGIFTKNKNHDTNKNIRGEDSSSMASDYSQSSTPVARSRRRRKIWGGRRRLGESGGAYSDSECSPPAWRHDFNHSYNVRPMSSNRDGKLTPEKVTGSRRRPELRHATSLTYGKDSQRVRENFLSSLRTKPKMQDGTLPIASSNNDRHSIYDNVPLVLCNKNYYDYHSDVRDVEMSTQEGSASSECTLESRESPFPSTQEDEDTDDRPSRRNTIDRWHSFNKKSPPYTTFREFSTHINGFSVGQMNHLRKRALLRLTALMERYCPVNRTAWNWELPKFMRKMKTPDYKDRIIFGVPLHIINQRTGQPLHPVILRAFSYMRKNCLDQVGIFRKPGVRTRIQRLKELHEFGEEVDYDSYCPCDIADMIKTYFRELPEVLLTNKLSEIFITICQYLPEETRVEALQCAMLMMPDENRETLMVFLTFLSDVAEQSHLNQMTANNLAVCMAPSLFHLNIGGAGSSPLRKRATGTPEQKDLHDNKASHQCMALMIVEVTKLMKIPIEMLSNCRFSYLDNSQPVSLEDLGTNYSNGLYVNAADWSSYMTACISSLLKETREKNRGWVHVNNTDSLLDISYRKVGDGHPLRLLRVITEVEAPPSELITRIVRERHLWDDCLLKWRVVSKLSKQAEVFQYMCSSMPQRPSMDFCVLRCWKTDLGNRVCVFVETSIEHSECPPLDGCLRGIVLASRYLIQPCGSGKSRITHLSRIDMRGRLPEWYNKVYPFIAALRLAKLRDSFCHNTSGPESNV